MAIFDGASRTVGELIEGPIEDFNVMTKQGSFEAEVRTLPQQQSINCSATQLNFFYSLQQSIDLQINQENIVLVIYCKLQLRQHKILQLVVKALLWF